MKMKMNKYTNEQILDFIRQFQEPDTIKVFSNGMCYWFAEILKTRFPGGIILYNDTVNHYSYYYDGIQYDIKGVHSILAYSGETAWDNFKELDELHTCRLYRDCINKTETADCENCINHNCKIKYNDETNYEKRKNP